MKIFVTIYTRGRLRIRRLVAEKPGYQNSGVVLSKISPTYLKELFKTALLLVIATVTSYVPTITTT